MDNYCISIRDILNAVGFLMDLLMGAVEAILNALNIPMPKASENVTTRHSHATTVITHTRTSRCRNSCHVTHTRTSRCRTQLPLPNMDINFGTLPDIDLGRLQITLPGFDTVNICGVDRRIEDCSPFDAWLATLKGLQWPLTDFCSPAAAYEKHPGMYCTTHGYRGFSGEFASNKEGAVAMCNDDDNCGGVAQWICADDTTPRAKPTPCCSASLKVGSFDLNNCCASGTLQLGRLTADEVARQHSFAGSYDDCVAWAVEKYGAGAGHVKYDDAANTCELSFIRGCGTNPAPKACPAPPPEQGWNLCGKANFNLANYGGNQCKPIVGSCTAAPSTRWQLVFEHLVGV